MNAEARVFQKKEAQYWFATRGEIVLRWP